MLNTDIKHTITDAESQTHALWMEAIISVSFPASCVFMRWDCRQHCITFICTGTEVIRSLWMLEMTPGALDSFHVAGAVLESVHKSDQINSRQGLPEVSVTNRFLIWFEWEKKSWIKSIWWKKKREGQPICGMCVCSVHLREYGKWFVFVRIYDQLNFTFRGNFMDRILFEAILESI